MQVFTEKTTGIKVLITLVLAGRRKREINYNGEIVYFK
jgi:hypothetical protein